MAMKKKNSLKTAFWKFLLMLIGGLAGAVLLPYGIMILSVSLGYATYADYSERSVERIAPIIAATPDLSEINLPVGCNYVLLDKNYQILGTTLAGDALEEAMEYAFSGKIDENVRKQYLLVTREKEYVILQYYIGSQFTNSWMNEHFPSPEWLLYIFIGVNCIVVCTILTSRFAKKLRIQLKPLFHATEEVAKQNLDFEVGHSAIKEFEEALKSFSDMKEQLKASLEQQWKAQQIQKEQIAALTHDLKTPLTIVQGNIDLLEETSLSEEQKAYVQYASESANQMTSYIQVLMEMLKTSMGYTLHKEVFVLQDFLKAIAPKISTMCQRKQIDFQFSPLEAPIYINGDKELLERVMMNLIDNAVTHTKEQGSITVELEYWKTGNAAIHVIDSGSGFSQKALKHAVEQFFMEDDSRGTRGHFGMGLYIANTMIEQHGGSLSVGNRKDGQGAVVTIQLPVSSIYNI